MNTLVLDLARKQISTLKMNQIQVSAIYYRYGEASFHLTYKYASPIIRNVIVAMGCLVLAGWIKISYSLSEELRTLAAEMGAICVSPRAIAIIRNDNHNQERQGLTKTIAESYIEEWRLMLLELIGYLPVYYSHDAYGSYKDSTSIEGEQQRWHP